MKVLVSVWVAGALTLCATLLVLVGACVFALVALHALERGKWL